MPIASSRTASRLRRHVGERAGLARQGHSGDPGRGHLRGLRRARLPVRPLDGAPAGGGSPAACCAAGSRRRPTRACASCAGSSCARAAGGRDPRRALAVRRPRPRRRQLPRLGRARRRRSSASPPARRWPTSSPGIMLAITQPLRVGDWVTFEDSYGVVEDVRLNFTVLRTPAEQRIVIPERAARERDPAQRHARDRRRRARRVGLARPPAPTSAARSTCSREQTEQSVTVAETHRRRRPARGRRRARARRRSAPGARRSCASSACGGCARTGSWAPDRAIPRARARDLGHRGEEPDRLYNRRFAVAPGGVRMSRSQRTGDAAAATAAALATRPCSGSSSCWCVIGMGGLAAVGYVVSIAASAPSLSSLKERDPGSNSEVLRRRRHAPGLHPGRRAAPAGRPSDEIPQVLKDATVAIEDERFYQHKGVDYEGIVRARRARTSSTGKTVQGGSTITMQLVRNLYITNERTYERKIREAKLAEELENEHTKEWILDKYLNTVPYGTVGGQSAIGAQGRRADLLRQAPRPARRCARPRCSPACRRRRRRTPRCAAPRAAQARRNEVLREMAELGHDHPGEAAARTARRGARARSVDVLHRRAARATSSTTSRTSCSRSTAPRRCARAACRSTRRSTSRSSRRRAPRSTASLAGVGPSSAIVTINPKNGYIEAMASSADYGESKFNLAAQGHRQPGSTFKVMALMAALRARRGPGHARPTSPSSPDQVRRPARTAARSRSRPTPARAAAT